MKKVASEREIHTSEQRVQVMKALDTGHSCRDVVLKFGCGKSQISRIRIVLLSLYVYMYVYKLFQNFLTCSHL